VSDVSAADDPSAMPPDDDLAAPRASVRKIVVRVLIVVAALGISGFVLYRTFDDLDIGEVWDALTSLGDAEVIALLATWLLWIASQGMQTVSLLRGIPVRRGILAFLGPSAVSSVVPGPSDLPVRHRMMRSWGRDAGEVTLAVAAGGVFNIGIKLVLPVVAVVGLLISDAPVEGALRTVAVIAVLVGLSAAVVAFALASESRTATAVRLVAPIWTRLMRLLRKPPNEDLATNLLEARARSVGVLRGRWVHATWGTFLTAATRFSLLLMSLRFMDVTEGQVSWAQVFVVYALVQGLTVLPLTAGDAGVSEIALIGMLTAAAGSDMVNQVTAAVVIFRLLTWLLIIPIGLAALGVWRASLRHAAKQGATRPAAP
jgi:uncharacterized membrane protein YbhN (UPF0104 family)